MTTYSNVTKEQMAEILANSDKTRKVSVPEHVTLQPVVQNDTKCVYAEDTGEIAFLRAPCRGNKIICHKIDGHISYTKACNPNNCKFYEKSVDDNAL
jgi:hypothetical protein